MLHTALLTVLLGPLAHAQDAAPPPRHRPPPPELDVTEVALGAGFGFLWVPLRRWNGILSDAGYPEYGPIQITPLSINGDLWANRHVPGFDYLEYTNVGGEGGKDGIDGHKTFLKIQLTELSYGYAVVHTKGFSLVPQAGAGLMHVTQRIQPVGTVAFDDALADPGRSLSFTKTLFVADLGLDISYLAAIGGHDKLGIQTGWRFTLRIGGMVQLFNTGKGDKRWTQEGQPLAGTPDLFIVGPYARIMVFPSLLHRAKHKGRG
ncbi:MAG: hypothetical protein H6733_17180 [Alphaproteobacteria bacterium]|nr:hypothetical protein [Alphaproteobacteria bacterium]